MIQNEIRLLKRQPKAQAITAGKSGDTIRETKRVNLVGTLKTFLPLPPNEVLKRAINGNAAAVAIRLGKSDNTIYKMFENPQFCRYSRFLQLFYAIHSEVPEGAEMIYEDFRARVSALRVKGMAGITDTAWLEQVAECEREHSEALRAALLSRDAAAIRREITQDITAKRKLLTMLQARENANAKQ